MPWYTLEQAAAAKNTSQRNLFRLIQRKKLMSRKNDGQTEIWISDNPPSPLGEGRGEVIQVPEVHPSKLTDDIMNKVNAMLRSITPSPAGEGWGEVEQRIDDETGLPAGTQRRWKADLRELYGLPPRSDLSQLVNHPKIKQALAHIIIRKAPSDTGEMRSAKNLLIISSTSGQIFSLEAFLKSAYSHNGNNSLDCHRALLAAARSKRLLFEATHEPATEKDLPSYGSVKRWLRKQTQGRDGLALRRARMDRSERIADSVYVTRPKEEYYPGELLEADHTEDNTLVYRNDGKVRPFWWTAFVDFRTGIWAGYEIAYRANSDTIALAYKRACLGSQIFAAVIEDGKTVYKPVNVRNAPRILRYDWGKDFASAYGRQSVGTIDFRDDARRYVQLISEIQHTGKRYPQAKGTVEGAFAIVQRIMKYLPGYKGSNYTRKPDSLKQEVDAGSLLCEDEYRQLVPLAINVIANRPRRRLGGLSPVQVYLMAQGQFRAVDEAALNFIQMKWKRDTKIARGYVEMAGGKYFTPELEAYNGEYAQLYYDPQEIGRVAVYIGGEFKAFAIDKDLLGKSEREWMHVIHERARLNKIVREEIASIRQGITLEEIKAMVFQGVVSDIVTVSSDLISGKPPKVVDLLGIESKAREYNEKLATQMQQEDVQKKRDDAKKGPMKLINITKLKEM